ncbi:hypothetical protein [Altererythrobacter sp. TH136]|uniref:hypothetical protein n=1 Tax=Altererythrobacter sp. TH136 TaxID=2067415 RepID=UPI0011625CEC|nr:hypothetical protein [Altererythrobacter sp. TH136]QDM41462.1 hypothetical protein C0V74_10730 [Altererythrobacter sp. TH136]
MAENSGGKLTMSNGRPLLAAALCFAFVSACDDKPQVVDTTLPDIETETASAETELPVESSEAIRLHETAPSVSAESEAAAKPADAFSSEEKKLIETWQDLNGRCRGGSGDDPQTMTACDERDGPVAAQLADANICYGREGEYGYQMELHRCGPDSTRFERSD